MNYLIYLTLIKTLISIKFDYPNESTRYLEVDSLSNIKIDYEKFKWPTDEKLHFTLSKCNCPDYSKEIEIYDLPTPSEWSNSTTYPKKFIWKVPLPGHMYYFSGQCVKLWNSKKELLTQSAPFDLMLSKFIGVTDQDFVVYDAVSEYDNGLLPKVVDEAPKTVGIVGGGISGMFSALLLDRLNLGYKIHMHELKDRLGGRMESHRFYRKNSDGEEEEIAFCDLGAHFLPLFKYTVNGIKIDVNHDITRKLINKLNYLNQNTSIPMIEIIPVNNPPDISPMAHRGDDQYKDGIDNFVNAISLKMKNVHYHHNIFTTKLAKESTIRSPMIMLLSVLH
ncbi:hypothetical protein CONCODRAFT_87996 [Conidiobolus coronatus NRRL 28638]|uniref:Amine oxidase domain-containing protein n=1 Tax=Conidiobolus coronatus (strain ATCC 28846 / CBS 209.66 / NRRL 28638) TaxID=796925 RepID=A0A137NQ80_CONC2|nr:hypothetical protein CONCODRAFT_87996 [Conidiobolus coronatus NRRL 28638]|eukprot:KXN64906.1 hypothetical protein CONCODRAFT_87996 [Conidiobolus coronatus NRRL 28638]